MHSLVTNAPVSLLAHLHASYIPSFPPSTPKSLPTRISPSPSSKSLLFPPHLQGVKKDHLKAAEYFKRAADKIAPLVVDNGRFVPPPGLDVAKSTETQQSLLSMFDLGLIYSQGEDGVEADPMEACRWWHRAAIYRHPQSMYNFGAWSHAMYLETFPMTVFTAALPACRHHSQA